MKAWSDAGRHKGMSQIFKNKASSTQPSSDGNVKTNEKWRSGVLAALKKEGESSNG